MRLKRKINLPKFFLLLSGKNVPDNKNLSFDDFIKGKIRESRK